MLTLPIDKIRTDGGTQPRESVSFEVVDTYQDAMQDGAVFPPIDVFYDGTDYWLADGFHRAKAAFQADREEIECTIHQGTLADAQWFSFGANKSNGLYRSNADKQRAVKAALGHEKSVKLSDVQVAKHCGVSQPFVGKLRADILSYNGYKIERPRTVTRGNSTYQQNTANIGRTPKSPEVSKPESTREPRGPEPIAPFVVAEEPMEDVPFEFSGQESPASQPATEVQAEAPQPVDVDDWNDIHDAILTLARHRLTAFDFVANADHFEFSAISSATQSAYAFVGQLVTQIQEKRTA